MIAADFVWARLLKFNCDRAVQRSIFVETIERALRRRLSWPQVVIAIGRDHDCVDSLVERLYSLELPAVLHSAKLRPETESKLLEWPPEEYDEHATTQAVGESGELQKAVAQSLGLQRSAPRVRIVRELSAFGRAVVFHFDINGEKYDDRKRQELINALEWFGGLSTEVSTPYPIVVMPWFTVRHSRLSSFFGYDRVKILSSQLRSITNFGTVHDRLTILPPLGMITYQDAIDWLNENKRHAAEQPANYAVKLADFFASSLGPNKSVPMSEASDFFASLIREMAISRTQIVSEGRQA